MGSPQEYEAAKRMFAAVAGSFNEMNKEHFNSDYEESSTSMWLHRDTRDKHVLKQLNEIIISETMLRRKLGKRPMFSVLQSLDGLKYETPVTTIKEAITAAASTVLHRRKTEPDKKPICMSVLHLENGRNIILNERQKSPQERINIALLALGKIVVAECVGDNKDHPSESLTIAIKAIREMG